MRRMWTLAVVPTLAFNSCSALEAVGLVSDPAKFIVDEQPREVQAVLTDGTMYVLERPSVAAGNLAGWDPLSQEDVSLPFSDVRRVDAWRIDPLRLRLAIVGAALLAGGLTYAWLNSGEEEEAPWCVMNVPYGLECGPMPDASLVQFKVPAPW